MQAAVRFDRGSPTLVISNRSRIDDDEARAVTAAIQKQVDRDFFPLWGWRARLVFRGRGAPGRHAPSGAMHLILRDASPDAYAGYHFIDGLPEADVFTRDASGPLPDWHATLSHEVLEMIADPGVNLYARGHVRQRGRRRAAFVAYEVCDPVQAISYRIDGVSVSDFVTPEWFEPERQPGALKFSFRDSVTRPFELADGGYIDAYVGGELITVWGNPERPKERRYRRARRA
ncbi:MAG TPA: hypothetical protein VMG12_27965 [Polyangiaceae bacterium]|nr:hypothetical protein [Polyangiaceae bacterium]